MVSWLLRGGRDQTGWPYLTHANRRDPARQQRDPRVSRARQRTRSAHRSTATSTPTLPPARDTAHAAATHTPPLPPGERPPGPLAAFPLSRDTVTFKGQLANGGDAIPACRTVPIRITGDSIGPFRLDETIAELKRACPRLLYGWVGISDGYPVPMLAARLGG